MDRNTKRFFDITKETHEGLFDVQQTLQVSKSAGYIQLTFEIVH